MQPEGNGEVPLIRELIETVERGLGKRDMTVEEVRIGVFYTAVKLDSGQAGVAFTPIREIPEAVCCPRSASRMPSAGQLAGQSAWDLTRYALTESPLKIAVGIATLNALSALLMEEKGLPGYQRLMGADALDVVDIHPDDRVALVGAFVPFIKKLKETVMASGSVTYYLVSKITVGKIMTRDVFIVSEYTPLEEAARIMADNSSTPTTHILPSASSHTREETGTYETNDVTYFYFAHWQAPVRFGTSHTLVRGG